MQVSSVLSCEGHLHLILTDDVPELYLQLTSETNLLMMTVHVMQHDAGGLSVWS